jgi:hypothetical protein
MSASEVTWRLQDAARHQTWRHHHVRPGTPFLVPPVHSPRFVSTLPLAAAQLVSESAAQPVLAAADGLLDGRWEVLGVARKDVDMPDWFFDPVTGRRAPQTQYCFAIDHRSEAVTGNVKQVWELSRLQHVTLLATAYALSRSDRYAEAAAGQLRSWWDANPFLSGVHWTSGIELGIRLISWVWTRRLLDGWPGASELFEENDQALAQIWWHQKYLAAFPSRGSSANNHLIAEAAGQLVGALGFPWFAESDGWADQARALLQKAMVDNTLPSGVNREMAFEYHGFVAELGLLAAVEADRAGRPLDAESRTILCRMLDVIAATLDERLRAPRYGDADDGRGILLGPPDANRWVTLLAAGSALFGRQEWWPLCGPDAASTLLVSLGRPTAIGDRPVARPGEFRDAGLTILRTPTADGPEIWCRCDGGPHGFLAIAAHAHADALSVEVRHGGVDILADPGTYCYHGEDRWRAYFRSTLAHNTVQVAGVDQSTPGGHFLWTRQARTCVLAVTPEENTELQEWCAEHDGYTVLDPPVVHRRTVRLLRSSRQIEIRDQLDSAGSHPLRIVYHLGPSVRADLDGTSVRLTWPGSHGAPAAGMLLLPAGMRWSLVRGSSDPVLGWYSAGFGHKEPATALVGEGDITGPGQRVTTLRFDR